MKLTPEQSAALSEFLEACERDSLKPLSALMDGWLGGRWPLKLGRHHHATLQQLRNGKQHRAFVAMVRGL